MRCSWGSWCQPLTSCWMPPRWIQLPWDRAPCCSDSEPCEPCVPCCGQVRLGCWGALMTVGVCLHLGWVMQSCPLLGHRLPRSPSWAVRLWQACPPWSFQTQPGTGSHLGTATQSHTTSASPGLTLGRQLPRYYEVLTAPISKVSAGSSSAEPPADLLPERVQQQPPTLSLVLCFSPWPDPGSVV